MEEVLVSMGIVLIKTLHYWEPPPRGKGDKWNKAKATAGRIRKGYKKVRNQLMFGFPTN